MTVAEILQEAPLSVALLTFCALAGLIWQLSQYRIVRALARATWVAFYRMRATRIMRQDSSNIWKADAFLKEAYRAKTLWEINPRVIAKAFLKELPRTGSAIGRRATTALMFARTYQTLANDAHLRNFMRFIFSHAAKTDNHPITYPVCVALHRAGFPFTQKQRARAVLLAMHADRTDKDIFAEDRQPGVRKRLAEAERLFNLPLAKALELNATPKSLQIDQTTSPPESARLQA
jgi:hypothetical protein